MSQYRDYSRRSYIRLQERPVALVFLIWLCLFLVALFGFCLQAPSFGYESDTSDLAIKQGADNNHKRISLALPRPALAAPSNLQKNRPIGSVEIKDVSGFYRNLACNASFKATSLPMACLNFANKPLEATIVTASSISEYLAEQDKFPYKNALSRTSPHLNEKDRFHYMYTPGYGIYKWSSPDELLSFGSFVRMLFGEPLFH